MIFGLIVSAASVWWVVQFVGKENLVSAFDRVDRTLLVSAFCMTVVGYVLRSWRWRYFFDHATPSFFTAMKCLFVGFFMNNVLPARMGEFVRAHVGGRATDQSRTTVLATIAGERLADGVTISAIFGLLFLFGATAQEREDAQGILYVAAGFFAVAVGTVIVVWQMERVFALLDLIAKRVKSAPFQFVIKKSKHFAHGLKPMFQPRKLAYLTVWSIVVWGLELFAYSQIATAFGQNLSLGTLGLFLAAVNFSSLIPSAPGAVGVIEMFATLALHHVGVDKDVALAMVATQHIIQFIAVGIPGVLFFFLSVRTPKEPPPTTVGS